VDDHLLPPACGAAGEEPGSVPLVRPRAEGGELVRHHSHPPARSICRPARRPDRKGLRRRRRLPARAEGAAGNVVVELADMRPRRARAAGSRGGDHDPAAGDRVAAKLWRRLGVQRDSGGSLANTRRSSSGSGRMSVEVRSEDISSTVCRKRSCSVIGFSLMTLAASFRRSEA